MEQPPLLTAPTIALAHNTVIDDLVDQPPLQTDPQSQLDKKS